jgi:hypothetical protein
MACEKKAGNVGFSISTMFKKLTHARDQSKDYFLVHLQKMLTFWYGAVFGVIRNTVPITYAVGIQGEEPLTINIPLFLYNIIQYY